MCACGLVGERVSMFMSVNKCERVNKCVHVSKCMMHVSKCVRVDK